MKIACVLFKYFPFGGLQRDFFRIASACARQGHEIEVFTLSWQGLKPDNFKVTIVPVKSMRNHIRYKRFEWWLQDYFKRQPVDVVVGFNKVASLDIYYAADSCYEEKSQTLRRRYYRLTQRYRYFHEAENSVFSPAAKTEILLISAKQKPIFQHYYGTPEERFHLLPPGISPDRKAMGDTSRRRTLFRQKFQLRDGELLILLVGSGFKTKGLDRALLAMKALPEPLRSHSRLIAVGQDNPKQFSAYAKKLGLGKRLTILTGRDDIPDFLLGADVLIHPAYNENTGTILLEALVAGLPVLTTDVCGYAHYIEKAQAGMVIKSPFSQANLNEALLTMLENKEKRRQWQANGLAFADVADLYSMPEQAAELIISLARQKKSAKGKVAGSATGA